MARIMGILKHKLFLVQIALEIHGDKVMNKVTPESPDAGLAY